jgi:PiT family inorganic phosphate transporter
VKWGIAGRMVWAWVLTIPITGTLAYCFLRILHSFGMA